ncbi:MAG TPA: hypothetical protein VHY58_05405 [Streptosporangiaceae bacterium]|jgi:hypothetical protein|nr:hypothetical protein [Streptosporangiaceae bacterium]
MTNQPDDRTVEEEIRRAAARLDPVPPELMQAATDAFAFRDLDAELAELVFDSLLDADSATLVRSSGDRRMVSFKTAELTIDIEVSRTGSDRQVMGQIMPPGPATVEIRHRNGVSTVDADELGRFSSAELRAGPLSLRLRQAGQPGPVVVTDWVAI